MTRIRKKPRAIAACPSCAVPAKVTGIKPGRNATINDIARLASVSKKTVSRVINQSPLVQEATRARIQAVIDKFGYVPDPQARGLAFRKAFLIGLVYDNPNAQYIVNCMEGALDAVRNSEYEVVVHPCDRKKPDFITGVRRFVERQKLRGVILLPPVSENDELTRALTAADCSYVRITYTAARRSVAHGHFQRPARGRGSGQLPRFAGPQAHRLHRRPPGFRSAVERLAGFREALVARGIPFPARTHRRRRLHLRDPASPAARSCWRSSPRPTAIFASNDEMAAGVYRVANRLGLSIPGDLSIVGFDDGPLGVAPAALAHHHPPADSRAGTHWPLTRSCIRKPRAARTPW